MNDTYICQHCRRLRYRESPVGRKPKYCSDACKQAAYRYRKEVAGWADMLAALRNEVAAAAAVEKNRLP